MQLKTSIEIADFSFKIDYKHYMLSLGSCFAHHIASKMSDCFYNIQSNPFGTLYNPLSVRNSLGLLLNNYQFQAEDLFFHKGQWHSFQHHSSFSNANAELALEGIKASLQQARAVLTKTNVLMLTFGTAWVYELKQQGGLVSNCHQLPASRFKRRRLEVQEIVAQLQPVFNYLKKQLPALQILLSVSPVRYLKDGFKEHQISKSILLLAVNNLVENASFVHYFPSYEILIDDLRDYRFYKEDMIHPSALAISYVWDCFEKSLLSTKEQSLRKKLVKIRKSLSHRSIQPNSVAHQHFVHAQLKSIRALLHKYPYLPLEQALHYYTEQLASA
jgi:hypothetical protein